MILTEIFKIDANLNLGNLNLQPPPESDEPPDPPSPPPAAGPGPGAGGSGRNRSFPGGGTAGGGAEDNVTDEFRSNGTSGFRQNSGSVPLAVNSSDPGEHTTEPARRKRTESEGSEVCVLEPPRIPTPEIIDLIESDPEEDAETAGGAGDGADSAEDGAPDHEAEEEVRMEAEAEDEADGSYDVTNDVQDDSEDEVEYPSRDSGIVNENAEDDTVRWSSITIPEAPKLIPKTFENDSFEGDLPVELGKKRRGRGKGKKGKSKKNLKSNTISASKVKKEPPVAKVQPTVRPFSSPTTLDPGMIVFRGKIISADEKPKPTATVRGVRKHNHNVWTLTGLKRAESLVAIKEEKSTHECDECDAIFEKYRSLQVHKQRIHNRNMTGECPECGKKLSSMGSVKKHLLSHRPEHEWPFECPLCHKKFQVTVFSNSIRILFFF